MFLLASPLSALARVLAPPQNAARNLLQSCTVGSWSAPQAGGQTNLGSIAPLSVQRVDTNSTWANVRDNSCMPGGKEYLPAHDFSFAFDSVVGPTSPFEPLDDATQAEVRRDLATLSQSVNLTFHEISAGPVGRANLLFFRARTQSASSTDPSWVGTVPGGLASPDVAGVFQGRYNGPTSERLAAIGNALGLTYKGGLGFNNTNGQQGKFLTNTMSSVTFARENTCVNVNQFGPLDLAALSLKYGMPSPGTVKTYNVVDGNSSGGILANYALGNGPVLPNGLSGNTLRAVYDGVQPLVLSLEADGNSFTRVGNTYRLLAPGSVVLNADISQTRGGLVIGNNGTNHLVGSPFDDVFRVGARLNNITTGGGADSIILQYAGANVTVTDFSPQDKLYAPHLNSTANILASARTDGSGFGILLPDSTSVLLAGVQSFNVASSLLVGTNPPNNFFLPPCPFEQSAPVTPPPPPAPPATATPSKPGTQSSDPCSNIGSAGMGGALGACGASLNMPGLVPQIAWAP